jgi:diguanylate cyclase (GGDEF)-like protein
MAEKSAEKRIMILQALNDIHHSIGVNLELETISRILVEKLVEIVDCTGCAILFIDGKNVNILAEYGFRKLLGDQEFTADMPAIKHIVDTGRCIQTGDIANSPASSCVPAGCSMKSLICTPVVVKDQVRGIIHLDSPQKDAFDNEDMQFVELLAQEISIAMERSMMHNEVKALSVRDALTGCYNRRKMDADLHAEIARARRYQNPLSLLMIDIDWFKKYNDQHGHGKGDELLKRIVDIFGRLIRSSDTAYRYGGEEFAILLPAADKDEAVVIAKRLQQVIEEKEFEGERESQPGGKVTISIGVATYPWDGNNADELLKSADTELYQAKRNGRNQVCGYCEQSGKGATAKNFPCRDDETS